MSLGARRVRHKVLAQHGQVGPARRASGQTSMGRRAPVERARIAVRGHRRGGRAAGPGLASSGRETVSARIQAINSGGTRHGPAVELRFRLAPPRVRPTGATSEGGTRQVWFRRALPCSELTKYRRAGAKHPFPRTRVPSSESQHPFPRTRVPNNGAPPPALAAREAQRQGSGCRGGGGRRGEAGGGGGRRGEAGRQRESGPRAPLGWSGARGGSVPLVGRSRPPRHTVGTLPEATAGPADREPALMPRTYPQVIHPVDGHAEGSERSAPGAQPVPPARA